MHYYISIIKLNSKHYLKYYNYDMGQDEMIKEIYVCEKLIPSFFPVISPLSQIEQLGNQCWVQDILGRRPATSTNHSFLIQRRM